VIVRLEIVTVAAAMLKTGPCPLPATLVTRAPAPRIVTSLVTSSSPPLAPWSTSWCVPAGTTIVSAPGNAGVAAAARAARMLVHDVPAHEPPSFVVVTVKVSAEAGAAVSSVSAAARIPSLRMEAR
jgi:hypothetical protein